MRSSMRLEHGVWLGAVGIFISLLFPAAIFAGATSVASAVRLPGAIAASEAQAEAIRNVVAVLRPARPAAAELMASRLAILGAGHIPAIFQIFHRGAAPGPDGSAEAKDVALEPAQERALLLAMKRMGPAVNRYFRELSRLSGDREVRMSAVRALGEIASSAELRLMLDLTRPKPEEISPADSIAVTEELSDADADRFRAAIEAMLLRDADALAQVESLLPLAEAEYASPMIHAVANQNSRSALAVLTRHLGSRQELDGLLLTDIGKCAAAQPAPFTQDVNAAVRRYLSASTAELVREAALVIGRLEDSDALPNLVTLLSHSDRGVRQNAHWSLKRITGLYFAADPKAWSPWLELEMAWWRDTAPKLFEKLERAPIGEAMASVQQIARRRYPRHTLAGELTRALTHPEAEVRRLACVALGQFRSRPAVEGLINVLDDPDPELRAAAHRALRSITGTDLPPERASWIAAGL